MNISFIPMFLGLAWLLPLASFVVIVFFGPKLGRRGVGAGYLATGAIVASMLLSLFSLMVWIGEYGFEGEQHADGVQTEEALSHDPSTLTPTPVAAAGHEGSVTEPTPDEIVASQEVHATTGLVADDHGKTPAEPIEGEWYTLAAFGDLKITIGYYIDALTLVMFSMVTIIASCIHFYSFGYMHEELGGVTDPLAKTRDGKPLRRIGRFHRFYQYLSLFCFSMLGLVIAGNLAMVFIFWELVGICSYLLIGFYIERKSASNAANKAFIVNRVGDFGMIIGLMVIFSTLGTFSFGEIFEKVRPAESGYALQVPDGMVEAAAYDEVAEIYLTAPDEDAAKAAVAAAIPTWRENGYGYGLLMVAGLGIFCGCVGKSAQFPLHVWLPDAMEGPTPVSALIHAATMVAAGVYLIGRFYPAFTPEVLLVIAIIGAITLFMAATIAITATDIKRVLAYSTLSQLGYMTLALGVGGWVAGLFHLITHAFFKALLFLCSGSVIHACGTNEMPKMGGLLKKMPYTAYTMLIGCLAISGAGIPLLFGFSGYYSKDSLLAQVYSFSNVNPTIGTILFWTAAGGAAITAFYMFRLWFMTFIGEPRNKPVFEHAHESPRSMVGPLVVLAVFAVIAGWNIPFVGLGDRPLLDQVLGQARPSGVELGLESATVIHPAEHLSHLDAVHVPVSWIAFFTALTGFLLAGAFYGLNRLDPDDVRRRFFPIYWFLKRKWYFDELYRAIFVRPVMAVAEAVSTIDTEGIDWVADGSTRFVRWVSRLDGWIDRVFVDGAVNGLGSCVYRTGVWLRRIQTGNLQAYVMWIAVGTIALFVFTTLYKG